MGALPSSTVRLIQQLAICHAIRHGEIRLGTVTTVTAEPIRRRGVIGIAVGLEARDDLTGP